MKTNALLAVLLASVCGAASATTIDLGLFDEDTAPLAFNHKLASPLAADQSFTDLVDFSLSVANDASLSLTFVDNSKYAMTLDSWSLSEAGVGTITADAGSNFSAISYTGLGAGTYELSINGTLLKGYKGDSYGGDIISEVAPVPEPETYALMVAGLGMLGLMARRRRAD
jgi:hypothetical protein